MSITLGVFAHVDAGKTTFSERILYETGTISGIGRVDHQNTLLDYHEIERKRGITVFSEQAAFTFADKTYYLIDTPGHIDFSLEMERALAIMDYGILVISAVEGIQGHTETIWKLAQAHQIPVFVFINKMDREGADLERVINQLQGMCNSPILNLEAGLTEAVIEQLAETDEELLDAYLEGDRLDWWEAAKEQTKSRKVVPVFHGSALKGEGISHFLEGLSRLMETNYDPKAPLAYEVYKIRHTDKGERLTYLKILSGRLKVREEVGLDKINELRFYQGAKYQQLQEAVAGQLVVATGLCQGLKDMGRATVLRVSVIHEAPHDVLKMFRILESEDPGLAVEWLEEQASILISVMGSIQLEVLEQVLLERFGQRVSFGPRQVIYLETLEAPVIGKGHYEPLKHYAEVHLRLEPAPRGSGIAFKSDCHIHRLSESAQNLIRQHVLEQAPKGVLTGSRLADLQITLLTGAIHEKHTHGGDLLEATSRAIRQGLKKGRPRLLEPLYQVKLQLPLDLMGRALTDIQKAFGKFSEPLVEGETCYIDALVPVATFMDYPIEFLSITKGRGQIHLQVAGYEYAHNEKEVIEAVGYDSEADRKYPAGSIFCAKGAGFTVPWDEADGYMHL